jgi:hypothetical protein
VISTTEGFVTASYVHLDHSSPNTRVDLDLLLCQVLYLSPELLESVEDLILGLHEEDP